MRGPEVHLASLKSPLARSFTMDQARSLSGILRALGDPVRLRMLHLLAYHGELTGTDLREAIGTLTQPTISHHLGILQAAGVITSRKVGVWSVHTLNREALASIGDLLGGER